MVVEKPIEARPKVRIERMGTEDIDRVVELDKKSFPTPWSASAYRTEIHNPSAYYIVAKIDGGTVGYAGAWLIMDEVHITTIGVDPEYRGRKIGERLLLALLDEAIYRGARRATLEVRKSNTVAQNLYRKYHFHTVAVRKGYYTNNGEDALVMWVDDMQSPEFLQSFRIGKERLRETA